MAFSLSEASRRAIGHPAVNQALRAMERNPTLDLAAKDVTCFILPQSVVALIRDPKGNKLLDDLPNSLALLGITLGFQNRLPAVLRRLVAPLSGVSAQTLAAELSPASSLPPQEKLARLAVAFGFYFIFGAGFAAMAPLRNWLTYQRTGFNKFENIVGLDKTTAPPDTLFAQRMVRLFTQIVGGGIGLSAASVLGFSALSRMPATWLAKPGIQQGIQTIFNLFKLTGKRSGEVGTPLAAALFWLASPYLGWELAHRSRNEKLENRLTWANSMLWFSLMTPLLLKGRYVEAMEALKVSSKNATASSSFRRIWNRLAAGFSGSMPTFQQIDVMPPAIKLQALNLKNEFTLLSWLVPAAMLAITPQIINMWLTNRRFRQGDAMRTILPTKINHAMPMFSAFLTKA